MNFLIGCSSSGN